MRSGWPASGAEELRELPEHRGAAVRRGIALKLPRLVAADEAEDDPGLRPGGESSKVALTKPSVDTAVPVSPASRQKGRS